jgi:predicted GNAT family acetyltransferase
VDEQTVAVRNDDARRQYVATLNGAEAGIAAYLADDEIVTFTHTEVDPDFEGHGVGSELAREALDDVRRQGKKVRPVCPFIAKFISEHDEYADLVTR